MKAAKSNTTIEDTNRKEIINESSPTVANFMSGLKTLLEDMQKGVQTWNKERESIFDREDNLIVDTDPRIKAIRIIETLGKERIRPNELIMSVHAKLREIETYDRFLATEIGKAIGWQQEENNIPAKALTIIAKYDNDRIFQHFSKYYSYYNEKINASHNPYLSRWSMTLIDYFLSNYNKWMQMIKQIADQSESVKLLSQHKDVRTGVEGLKSLVGNLEKIMDKELKNLSSLEPAIDIAPIYRLINHDEGLAYLGEIVLKIERGKNEGMWEEFRQVQKAAKQKIPASIETTYGDYETAELFKQWSKPGKGGLHDYPDLWSKEIRKRISEVQRNWPFIFSQGLRTFYLLCQKCQKLADDRFDPDFNRIKEKAKQLIRKEEKAPKDSVKTILRLTQKEKDDIVKEIDKVRKELLAAEKKMMVKVDEFWETVDQFFKESGSDDLQQHCSNAQQKIIQEAATSAELAHRIGSYGFAYDISLGTQLIGRIAEVRAREDDIVKRSSLIAYSILRYGREIVEKKLKADEAIDKSMDMLMKLRGGIRNG
ncbi:MAG TPA: hypothetical protein VFF28_04415 [Candidatus Nanoarchaeia archaeon]|nr:hypothetical protein [Candidatus Nanoarchaeia archaeon]